MGCNFRPGLVIYGKAAILVFGLVTLGVGLHSHFQSAWVKKTPVISNNLEGELRPYELCTVLNWFPDSGLKCPGISMERYFVAIIIIAYLISLLAFIGEFVLDLKSHPLKFFDFGFHISAGILIIVAGIVYIVSAHQIRNIVKAMDADLNYLIGNLGNLSFRGTEKIVGGILAIVQSILYGVVALFILKD